MIGMQNKPTASNLIGHILLIGLCLLVLFPLYWMIVTSLRPSEDFFKVSLVPSRLTLEHYDYALNNLPIARLFLNTGAMALARTVAQILTALFAAFAFA